MLATVLVHHVIVVEQPRQRVVVVSEVLANDFLVIPFEFVPLKVPFDRPRRILIGHSWLELREVHAWKRKILLEPATAVDCVVGVRMEGTLKLESFGAHPSLVHTLLFGDLIDKLFVFVFDAAVRDA